jgi:hypothetical protein
MRVAPTEPPNAPIEAANPPNSAPQVIRFTETGPEEDTTMRRPMMAPIEPNQQDYPYEGLAERVHVSRPSRLWTQGLSFVFPVCEVCGSLLADQQRHDEWHELIDPEDDNEN